MTASSGPAPKPTPRPATDDPAEQPAEHPTAKIAAAKTSPAKDVSTDASGKDAPGKVSTTKDTSGKVSTTKDTSAKTPAGGSARSGGGRHAAAAHKAASAPSGLATSAGAGAEPSMGQLVSDATTHLSNLVHSEIELAKLELRSTVKNAGTGAGLFGAAAVVLIFSLTFGFFALAEGIAALGLDRWLAFLIVFALQLVFVALAVYLGIKKVKRVKAPARTIKTTRETVDYLKRSRG